MLIKTASSIASYTVTGVIGKCEEHVTHHDLTKFIVLINIREYHTNIHIGPYDCTYYICMVLLRKISPQSGSASLCGGLLQKKKHE